MKLKSVVSLVALTIFTNIAHANISVFSSATNPCQNIAGAWNGTGYLSNWLLNCKYHGSGRVTKPDGAGKFNMDVSVDKEYGSFICPGHIHTNLPGTCNNESISLKTDYGNINGTVSATSGEASGRMSVVAGIGANVKIQIRRVG